VATTRHLRRGLPAPMARTNNYKLCSKTSIETAAAPCTADALRHAIVANAQTIAHDVPDRCMVIAKALLPSDVVARAASQ